MKKGSKLGRKLLPRSLEYREKMRKSNSVPRPWMVGTKRSILTREKMSKAQIGNKNFLGKKHSDISKEKIREGKLGEKTLCGGNIILRNIKRS